MAQEDLDALISRQCGLATMGQCRKAGMTAEAVEWRIRSGRWLRVHAGVYQTKPGRDDWYSTAMAGLLVCGEGAVLASSSAGFVHGLLPRPGPEVELMIPADRFVRPPEGVRVRRSRHLGQRTDEKDWPWRTTLENTILDLGERSSLDELIALCARGAQQELTTQQLIRQELVKRRRHRWRSALLEVLGDIAEGAESAAEVRYIRDVERAHGLPSGERQLAGAGPSRRGRHDNGYRDYQVIVEVDGRVGHEGWEGRRRDGGRDRSSAASGWLTTRVGWSDVAVTPCELALELAAILRDRGWTGSAQRCRSKGCAVLASGGERLRAASAVP